jgi:hypothetical protein
MSSSDVGAILDKGLPGSQDLGSNDPGSQDLGSQDVGSQDSGSQDQRITDASQAALRLAAELQRAVAEGRADVVTEEALQALVAAACRIYSARIEAGEKFHALPAGGQVMDTDVMVMASALLRAVNLQVFELGMWQSWTGR